MEESCPAGDQHDGDPTSDLGLTASRKLAGSVASSSVIFGVACCPLLQSTVWIYVD